MGALLRRMLSSHEAAAGSVTLLVVIEEATLTDAVEARTGMLTSWAVFLGEVSLNQCTGDVTQKCHQ